jgi:hypothetical protein
MGGGRDEELCYSRAATRDKLVRSRPTRHGPVVHASGRHGRASLPQLVWLCLRRRLVLVGLLGAAPPTGEEGRSGGSGRRMAAAARSRCAHQRR